MLDLVRRFLVVVFMNPIYPNWVVYSLREIADALGNALLAFQVAPRSALRVVLATDRTLVDQWDVPVLLQVELPPTTSPASVGDTSQTLDVVVDSSTVRHDLFPPF
jgi:hypothetical protein